VIVLTAQGSDADAVLGLEAGANDYVVKPFKFAVLLARIRAQLRQYEASEDAIFQIGPYTFRPGAKLLVNDRGSKLKLTEKETAILRYLYRAGAKVVSRDVLLAEVWGYNANVTTHTLETHIYRLRQKIETNPSTARILVTEPCAFSPSRRRSASCARGRFCSARATARMAATWWCEARSPWTSGVTARPRSSSASPARWSARPPCSGRSPARRRRSPASLPRSCASPRR
jgi:hypothetical protein